MTAALGNTHYQLMKGIEMRHKQCKQSSPETSTQAGQWFRGIWSALIQGFLSGIKPFGKAGSVLLATCLGAFGLLALGTGLIHMANEMGPPMQGFLIIAGEILVLCGSLLILAGSAVTWWRMFQVSFGHLSESRAAIRTNSSNKTPSGQRLSIAQQAKCDHDWQRDGQTLTAVRWTCSKCQKTEFR